MVVILIDPSEPVLQLTSVTLPVMLIAVGCVTLKVRCRVQRLASVTVTVYGPAVKLF